MNSIILKGRAKINLTLDVVGKRENGYHDLQMIMQTINLYDTIFIRKAKTPGIRLTANFSWLPTNEKNIAYRAAQLFFEEAGIEEYGVSIEITKRIPVAAGLAGGSTDAAATLVGLNRLYETFYKREKLMEMGLKLGADVPFCIARGTMLAEGIGEVLTPLKPVPSMHVVLVKPPISVSTASVYKGLDINNIKLHPDTPKMIQAIEAQSPYEIATHMANVLEEVTIPMHPIIGAIRRELVQHGAMGAMMSGSGSAVFGLFDSKEKANKAAQYFKIERSIREVYVTTTYSPIEKKKDKNGVKYGIKRRGVKGC
ncbi:4-(cytidine 5'-diphospho)-2-C-methyl-D-erythritol kinase [Cellulosilyticum lentocellum]|uniref:4-diphosphocytidyl-2-C-methyl-D-erythritol kinase n=1 Tax=Cellulosilyticum lentocellum (strain ATCC 49066 / DSM 5427 / NCIMB 11756 / RHM5) TaxID=642492 RepID=F2JM27_CELLD|nr:4-(cytidine 5'-diphospho)-2-C-methyl-D-erythritol kinase [Cellulosilyticum lentocellum]ADZ85807.1 4-diphosphocytidyl-2C-methyl-D-erythritol kinase [Cellulosilyticum lentocellum DSM 5427]